MRSIKTRVLIIALAFVMVLGMIPSNLQVSHAAEATHTVTFNSNGGSSVPEQTVADGETVEKPQDPTNGDLVFIGWFVNPTRDNIINMETYEPNTFDFDTPITEDIVLKALWLAPVSVNIDGYGRIDVVEEGEEPELEDEYPYQSSYYGAMIGINNRIVIGAKGVDGAEFKEWRDAETGETYSTAPILHIMVSKPLDLIAVFEGPCWVVFDSNGGSMFEQVGVPKGEKVAKPEDPTNGDLKFIGWFEDPTLETVLNYETLEYNTFDFNQPITEDKWLSGLWLVTLTVKTEGQGQISVADTVDELEYSDEYPYQFNYTNGIIGLYDTFAVGAKADEGYEFKEWKNADTGETFSTDMETDFGLFENLNLIAVFVPEGEAGGDKEEQTPTLEPEPTETEPTTGPAPSSSSTPSPSSSSAAPTTGDENNMLAWIVLSGAALIAFLYVFKKRTAR